MPFFRKKLKQNNQAIIFCNYIRKKITVGNAIILWDMENTPSSGSFQAGLAARIERIPDAFADEDTKQHHCE